MKLLTVALSLFPFLGIAQVTQTSSDAGGKGVSLSKEEQKEKRLGIQWIQGLNWQQIKELAKQEHKYIFLDCYTTWCGPCRMMDNDVYPDESVGQFFNGQFIAVKVQMDRTKKDDAFVQNWYGDAAMIGKQYHIEGFPTYIFLNPQGEIVNKEMGAMQVDKFLNMARTAIEPGKNYNDPYAQYDRQVAMFNQGVFHYEDLPSMITVAFRLQDTTNLYPLLKAHVDYVLTLKPEQRYITKNILLWQSLNPGPNTRMFTFFYEDGNKIDSIIMKKDFSKGVVDKTIMEYIIRPFLKQQSAGSGVSMSGAYLTGAKLKADYSEADWKQLKKMLAEKFSKECVRRNMLEARIEWYKRHFNYDASTCYMLQQMDLYPPLLSETGGNAISRINDVGWDAFIHITDKKLINRAIKWVERGVAKAPKNVDLLDTYANLLYKVGRKPEAMEWEAKAVSLAKGGSVDSYSKVLEQMRKGEHTYVNQGAKWE